MHIILQFPKLNNGCALLKNKYILFSGFLTVISGWALLEINTAYFVVYLNICVLFCGSSTVNRGLALLEIIASLSAVH